MLVVSVLWLFSDLWLFSALLCFFSRVAARDFFCVLPEIKLVPLLFCLDSLLFPAFALRRSMERQAPAWLNRHGAKLGLGAPSCS